MGSRADSLFPSCAWIMIGILLGLSVEASADVRTITGNGTYRLGKHDSRGEARRQALLDAKMEALDQTIALLSDIPSVERLGLEKETLKAYLIALVDFMDPSPGEADRGGPDVAARTKVRIDTAALERYLQVLLQNERAKAELSRTRDKIEGYRQQMAADTKQLATLTDPDEVQKLLQRRRETLDMVDTELQLARTWGLVLSAQSAKLPPPRDAAPEGRPQAPPPASGSSENAEEHRKRGVALNKERQYDSAITEFRLALQLVPNLPHAYLGWGAALQGKGDLDGAIVKYRLELDGHPDDSDTHNNLATALQGKGDIQGAIAAYRTALRITPDDPLTHFNLGTALVVAGKDQEAIAEYRTAIRLRQNFAEAYFDLGSLLSQNGQNGEAIDAFRSYLELAIDTPANKPWIEQARRFVEDLTDKSRHHRR